MPTSLGIFSSGNLAALFEPIERAVARGANSREINDAIARVKAIFERPESGGPRNVRGKSFFDRLQVRILDAVRSGSSREALLRDLIETLTGSPEERSALGYLVIEARVGSDGRMEAELVMQAGFNPKQYQNYLAGAARFWPESHILRELIEEQSSFDFVFTGWLGADAYIGEFEGLNPQPGRGLWFCAVALPSLERSLPDRALIGLYPATGRVDSPDLPRGARREWRAMEFTQLAYGLLNHQLAGRAEQVAAERRNLIADLAPTAINHEIRHQLKAVETYLGLALTHAQRIAGRASDDIDLANIFEALADSFGALDRADRITHAFMTLDRREAGAVIRAGDLLAEALVLLEFRMKKLGVDFEIAGETDLELRTNAPLLEHAVLNVAINALDAIETGRNREGAGFAAPGAWQGRAITRGRIAIHIQREHEFALFTIANNGPPIEDRLQIGVFEKGVTSKPPGQGHGQGLYICRLIASYLGGEASLAPRPPAGFHVAFLLRVPIETTTREDLGSARAEHLR